MSRETEGKLEGGVGRDLRVDLPRGGIDVEEEDFEDYGYEEEEDEDEDDEERSNMGDVNGDRRSRGERRDGLGR